jgi:hypothetical protein
MNAQGMAFSKIINADQGARDHFHVPKYQREYTWGQKEWEQLLQDVDENDHGYFMGSLICVNENQGAMPGDEIIHEVVDGQQRFTTLSLLLMAIHANLATAIPLHTFADATDKEDAQGMLSNIRTKLIKRKADGRPDEVGGFRVGKHTFFLRVQPSTQNHNLDDYRFVLKQVGLLEEQQKPPYFGNRRIWHAFSYFRKHLPTDVPQLLKVLDKINQLQFVQITVTSQSDAFKLFESLNNRGVPLSAIDIIKNKMLAEMERQHDVDIDESYNQWQELVAALPDVGEQERFLRHFYNTFKHLASVRVDAVSRATKSQVIRIYETLIKRKAADIFGRLTKQAGVYGELIHPSGNGGTGYREGLAELERVGATPAYQLLLFLRSVPLARQEAELFRRVVDLVRKYYIRRNVTDEPPTRDLDAANIEVIEACAAKVDEGATLTFDYVASQLLGGKGKPASLDKFKKELEGPLYSENLGMARYLLIQVDRLWKTREYGPDLWARDDKARFVWTVEHVLPQTENLPKEWVEMVAGGDKAKASALQEAVVDLLGNLTLSGYNSKLATAAFGKKQQLARDQTFLGHKINIGYQNGLALNKLSFDSGGQTVSLADAPNWSAQMIRDRTKTMIDLIMNENKLPCD